VSRRGFLDEGRPTGIIVCRRGGNSRSDLLDFAVQLHAETEKAWLVSDDGEKKNAKWIPKSQAELAEGILTCPEWLAKEKRLI
jgi:hypothetical protein